MRQSPHLQNDNSDAYLPYGIALGLKCISPLKSGEVKIDPSSQQEALSCVYSESDQLNLLNNELATHLKWQHCLKQTLYKIYKLYKLHSCGDSLRPMSFLSSHTYIGQSRRMFYKSVERGKLACRIRQLTMKIRVTLFRAPSRICLLQ